MTNPILISFEGPKVALFAAALSSGIEYARMCLCEHDQSLGRTIRKNRVWAEQMESDIRQMEDAIEWLRSHLPPDGLEG